MAAKAADSKTYPVSGQQLYRRQQPPFLSTLEDRQDN
jgi:hypothetical protein